MNIKQILTDSIRLKPTDLVISDLKWKYLVRSSMRAKNILMVGPTGCGKTIAAQSVAEVLNKNYFKFNMGSTQDARSSLIGNSNYDKATGTIFNESAFVKAIKTPESIILLDEINRAHHDVWNIIMSVLDPIQRYLRLDEKRDNEVVKVADGVTFIGTANIGNEYTATRVMDRALMNRFPVKIEMNFITVKQELDLMIKKYRLDTIENNSDIIETVGNLCEIAEHTRSQIKLDDGKLTNFLSTRSVCEMTEMAVDGFSLSEIAQVAIYPEFPNDGGIESERTYVKQLVQKYVPSATPDKSAFADPLSKTTTVPPF